MRTLTQSSDPKAAEAIEYFVFRIRRELGGMAAVLSGLDTVVFTGGIGENSALIREKVCEGQEWLGLEINPARNEAGAEVVSADTSRINILVIPTDEEAMIRHHTEKLLDTDG